jgi:hypothetical protein
MLPPPGNLSGPVVTPLMDPLVTPADHSLVLDDESSMHSNHTLGLPFQVSTLFFFYIVFMLRRLVALPHHWKILSLI